MNIPLKPEYADWVASQIDSGRYASEIEAIEAAVATKIQDDEAEFQRLRARLEESIAQVKRGEVVVADDAFWQRAYDRIDAIAAKNKKA